ncbi:hypothetical protein [Tessaracoccus sp. Z1128]
MGSLTMAIDLELCVSVRCDHCPVVVQDAAGRLHYWPSIEAAIHDLSGRPEPWHLTPDHATCPGCRAAAICEEQGHRWGNWKPLDFLGEPALIIHFCKRCDANEVADLVPSGEGAT